MKTDLYSIILACTTLFVSCLNLSRDLQNFDQYSLEASSNDRSAKLFPLFSIVKIQNQACVPENIESLGGTCFTNSQCRNSGGVASGVCAGGFGVCCVVTATCESVVTQNNTNFKNRDFPSPLNPSGLEVCNVRVQKPSSNVCQIKLDFGNMQLAEADTTTGQCMSDRLSINGASGAPVNLCGDLSGQHMFFDYGRSDRITISVIVDGAIQASRKWNVKITYIECNSLNRAPDGCLQYFTSATGEVKMLGYPMTPHLADLDYAVCVRSEDGAGSIVWTPCPGESSNAFIMTGDAPADASTPGTASDMCALDYVMIMTEDTASPPTRTTDRYCGSALTMMAPFLIRSISKPFIMRVKTDSTEEGDMGNTGFCLNFRQEPPRPQG